MQESICHSMHLIYMFIGESNLSFYPPFCDEQLDEIGKHFSSLESYSKTKDCILFLHETCESFKLYASKGEKWQIFIFLSC